MSQPNQSSPTTHGENENLIEEDEALIDQMCNLWVKDDWVSVKEENRYLQNIK